MDSRTVRVLAVSPRFAPVNGADTHRLRLLLPHAADAGWTVEVLAVSPNDADGPVDPWLGQRLPADVSVHRVGAWQMRGWGLNGLAQRSLVPLYREGCRLLAERRFDVVFFSTTEFALHVLGPLWRRKFGVPFCMDYQDPWVNDYYRRHPEVVPPGGRAKYAVADCLHRFLEARVTPRCSGFLAVSRTYLADLADRYGHIIEMQPWLVRPFPAEPDEFESMHRAIGAEGANSDADRPRIWRYIGRGGPDMRKAVEAFFRAWSMAVDNSPSGTDKIRFEAYGTSYAAAGRGGKTIEPLAGTATIAEWVTEDPRRVTYSEMLAMLLQSDALVLFGSDEAAYTASKLYPYLLAQRPLLAILHHQSPAAEMIRRVGGGVCVTFRDGDSVSELSAAVYEQWFAAGQCAKPVPLNHAEFEPFTAATQARDVGDWLRRIVCEAR